jgi:CheY-like chemotaxis protein
LRLRAIRPARERFVQERQRIVGRVIARTLSGESAGAWTTDPPREVGAAPARPRARILVVDDEPLIGTVIERTFQAEHDVTVVSSARAALERLDRGERFDLILSDLLMPGMSGMELHRELAAREPGLVRRMVFLTGGAFTPAARAFLERESVVCVEKPFELDAIRRVLAQRLAEPG